MSKFISHLRANYRFYILALVFTALALLSQKVQNTFFTHADQVYYRIPFWDIAVFTVIGLSVFAYVSSELCATQSANYKKIALTTSIYFLIEFFGFFMMRDKSKAQLLIYFIGFISAVVFYYHKDQRLKYDKDTEEYRQAFNLEAKSFRFFFWPLFWVAIILQAIFTFYPYAVFQLVFDPFLQIGLGLSLFLFAIMLVPTRLDNYKLLLLNLEIIVLIVGLIYYFAFAAVQIDFFISAKSQSYHLISIAVLAILIALANLMICSTKLVKSSLAAFTKLATSFGYLAFYVIGKGMILNYYA